ncbi:aminoglycoside phosphotransferase family protein [Microbacterium sp. NPDC091313]
MTQFPRWAELPLREVEHAGNDHRMFRLGEHLVARLPSDAEYVPQVAKEQEWLPRLAPQLPLPIPVIRARGKASPDFDAPWSIYGWRPGATLAAAPVSDAEGLAEDLAAFLVALRVADASAGPTPGAHSAYRGGPVDRWDDDIQVLRHRVSGRERGLVEGIWRDALAASFDGPAVWVHGDVAAGNLLVQHGRLSAVLDFGCSAVGDPACDTVPVWTFLRGTARVVFRRALDVDDATWARGRGWALWKGLIMLTNTAAGQAEFGRRVLDELFAGV